MRPFYVGRVPSHEQGFVATTAKRMRRQFKNKNKHAEQAVKEAGKKEAQEVKQENKVTTRSFPFAAVATHSIPVETKMEEKEEECHHHHCQRPVDEDEKRKLLRGPPKE